MIFEPLLFGTDAARRRRRLQHSFSILERRKWIVAGVLFLSAQMAFARSPRTLRFLSTQDTTPPNRTVDQQNKKTQGQPVQEIAAPTTGQTGGDRLAYHIGVEDELQISVWHEPELSTSVVVRPDGMITLPLLNDVKAAGLKTEELQLLLTDKLKGFVNEPQVTVIVRAIHSRKVYLVGEVAHQGTYSLNGDMTVLELLAAAGGLGPFAKSESIYILREKDGKKLRIPFHYKRAVTGKSENLALFPGDVVVVP
jgi:polysaccharide export outer membrane protein